MQDLTRRHINWPLIVRANNNIAPPSILRKEHSILHSDVVARQKIMYIDTHRFIIFVRNQPNIF